jgi:hypothetical protein
LTAVRRVGHDVLYSVESSRKSEVLSTLVRSWQSSISLQWQAFTRDKEIRMKQVFGQDLSTEEYRKPRGVLIQFLETAVPELQTCHRDQDTRCVGVMEHAVEQFVDGVLEGQADPRPMMGLPAALPSKNLRHADVIAASKMKTKILFGAMTTKPEGVKPRRLMAFRYGI